MIYLSNEPYPQEISVPRSFGVIVPQRNTYLSTADIAANLTTDSDQKVLAASQGVALKAMVDAKADATDIPTKTSDLQNDSGFVTGQEVSQTYETKSDATAKETALQNAINAKQDNLVSGENIKTINGESILGPGDINAGDPNAVKFTTQTLTDEQKAQARTNIGAGTYSKPVGGIPKTDFDNDVQNSLGKADSALQPAALTPITDLIPEQATPQNQLADKNFVNSSVATNTANYISDNGEPFQSLADLEAYSGPLTNNDYAFVVGTDSAGNTTYTRYKYNANTGEWAEEYVLNNSSFTAAQWAAISSGITELLVQKLTDLPTAVVTYVSQTLSDAEKEQARANIGAGTYSKPANGIPASDIERGVIPSVESLTTAEIDTIWNNAV